MSSNNNIITLATLWIHIFFGKKTNKTNYSQQDITSERQVKLSGMMKSHEVAER